MTVLVVAAGSPEAVESALPDRRLRHVDSVASTREALADRPAAVVVDRASLGPAADDLVSTVLALDERVPVVIVADEPVDADLRSFDAAVVRPFDDRELADAVECGLLVGEYDDAVGELYEQCRQRADGDPDPLAASPDLRRLRRDADAVLDDLVSLERADPVAAVLGYRADEDDDENDDEA